MSNDAEHLLATSKSAAKSGPPILDPQRFPLRLWLIALAGWMFDFYDLVLFSFLLIPRAAWQFPWCWRWAPRPGSGHCRNPMIALKAIIPGNAFDHRPLVPGRGW